MADRLTSTTTFPLPERDLIMANPCCVFLHIEGNPAQLEELRTKICEQDKDLLDLYCWFGFIGNGDNAYGIVNDIDEFAEEDGEISLDLTIQWDPHLSELSKVSLLFPKLTFSGDYEESGNLLYGEFFITNGAITDNPVDQETYLFKHDDEFSENIQNIEQAEYILPYLTERLDNVTDYLYEGLIEKHLLKKIKDTDLPLFINRSWCRDENKEEFNRRLKGIT